MGEAEGAAVEVGDLARNSKADARAVGLGGKKWREDVIHNLFADRSAVIAYRDDDMLVCIYATLDMYVAVGVML